MPDLANIPVPGQCFMSHGDWVAAGRVFPTDHPDHHDTERGGPARGWRGEHFTALCYDRMGRMCRTPFDMDRARDDDAFPVWWVWPDQIADLAMAGAALDRPFEAVHLQSFSKFSRWLNKASSWLTRHPDYNDTEHDGRARGWRGHHFRALCFDQKGRRCRNGAQFMAARDEDAFPVWWLWPDQIPGAVFKREVAVSHD